MNLGEIIVLILLVSWLIYLPFSYRNFNELLDERQLPSLGQRDIENE